MLGKTHLAVGVATAMAVMQPLTILEFVTGLGAAAVEAVISDIDVGTAKAHKDADVITAMAVVSVLAVVLLERFLHIGITECIMSDSNLLRIMF